MSILPFGLSREEALHFALMLASGMPSMDVASYFVPEEYRGNAGVTKDLHDGWMASAAVSAAVRQVQGKPWQEMTGDERIKHAIDKHYSEMAYFLYSHNYVEVSGADKTKADTCRSALEAKLAGMAGKTDALTRFWEDITTGRVVLAQKPATTPSQDRIN